MRFFLPLLVLVSSCTLNTDYFSEYRGTNLLGNWGFETGKWSLEPSAPATDYMTWQAVVGEDYLGSPAYRLEIKNLVPNGDFEDEATTPDAAASSVTPPNWTLVGGTVAFGTTHGSVTLSGRSLLWDSATAGNTLRLDLGAAIGASAWRTSTSYRVRFDYANMTTNPLEVWLLDGSFQALGDPSLANNGGDWVKTSTTQFASATLSEKFDQPSVLAARTLSWGKAGSPNVGTVAIDNVRVLPDAEPLFVKTALPSLRSGTLELLPGSKVGMYTLTLWVKDDPTAGDNNRFHPAALSIQVVAAVKSGTGNPSPQSFARPVGGWTTWTPLTLEFGFDFVNDDGALGGQPALSIEISPTQVGQGAVDVGSVLVARPTLTFNP